MTAAFDGAAYIRAMNATPVWYTCRSCGAQRKLTPFVAALADHDRYAMFPCIECGGTLDENGNWWRVCGCYEAAP